MRRRVTACALVIALGASLASVRASGAAQPGSDPFPRFPKLEANVAFWHNIFAKYSKLEIVFHDPVRLDLVYSVGDVSEIVNGDGTDAASQRAVRAFTRSEFDRIATILKRLEDSPPATDEERDLAERLRAAGPDLPRYSLLADRIRAQRGLADELCGAISRARPWLPEMKETLAANGVPVDLASLPLVESGFRVVAHSSVGAAGIWQFTRGTGRRYLRIDHVLDERRDPLRATEAAARYLRENYELLGTWPLAITGYNHGEGGVAAAVRQLGTTDLGEIAENYRGRAFGFASRNFYAEFLAARDVMQQADKYCGQPEPSERLERVHLDRYVALKHLADCAGVDRGTLAEMNPALQGDVAKGRLYVPKGYRMWLPASARPTFEIAYANLSNDQVHTQQSTYSSVAYHRVRSGQTLSDIAKQYRTSVAQLQRLNGISDARKLRAGQVVKVSTTVARSDDREASVKPAVAKTTIAPAGGETTYVMHRVARGQTLSHVAGHYGVSVAAIQSCNGIRNPGSVKAGQRIKIPRSSTGRADSYRTHRVGRGQTLSQIADLYRTSVTTLQKVNGISDPHQLRSGQVIQVPM